MILVNIPADRQLVTTEPIHEWDYGQQLKITGMDASLISEVHFYNRSCAEAIVRLGVISDGGVVVAIPDSLLENPYDINAFIYMRGDSYVEDTSVTSSTVGTYYVIEGVGGHYVYTEVLLPRDWGEGVTYYQHVCNGQTVQQIKIPTIPRKKPANFADPITPTEEEIMQQAANAVQAEVNQLSEMYEESWTYNELVAEIQDIISELPEGQKPMKNVTVTFVALPTPTQKLGIIQDAEFTANTFVEIFPADNNCRTLLQNLTDVTRTEGHVGITLSGLEAGTTYTANFTYWINKDTGQAAAAYVHK